MSLKTKVLGNIASNWFGLFANVLVGFFLAPFILHRLGNVAFGLYVLVFSFTGYYGLLDFGIRSSIVRFVARFDAMGEYEDLNRLVNTSLFSYTVVALLLLVVTVVSGFWVDTLFHVSTPLRQAVPILFLAVGVGIALGFPLSVFGGILEGLQRFYLLNVFQVASTLIRACLVVGALTHGGGLLSVGFIMVSLNLLTYIPYVVVVLKTVPLSFGTRFIDRSTFMKIARYGSGTFVIGIAENLRFGTDAVVIGMLISATAITFFSIASKLVHYSTEVVQHLAQVFTPMSSHFDATGNEDYLRKLLVAGNRACALIALPVCATLVVLGKAIIAAWVGPAYLVTYPVLLMLVIPRTLYVSQATSTKIMFGMDRHRPLAVVLVLEGGANLALSIALANRWGIEGVAIGTAIPLACTSLLFLPSYTCRLVKMRVASFLAKTYLLPIALCVPLVFTLLLVQHVLPDLTIRNLILDLLASGFVYGACCAWWLLTRDPMGVALRAEFSQYMQRMHTR